MSPRAAFEGVLREYNQGRYLPALLATEALKENGKATASYYFLQGAMLRHLERFDEAEVSLNRCASLETESKQLAVVYATLGNLQLDRGNPEEAIALLQASLGYSPDRGSTHRDLAEAYITQGQYGEAMNWAQMALDKEHGDLTLPAHVRNRNVGEQTATLAWAVASKSSDEGRVTQLVKRAVMAVGQQVIPSIAQVHTHAGLAYAVLGENDAGRHHFEIAAVADDEGLWGHRAKNLMREI